MWITYNLFRKKCWNKGVIIKNKYLISWCMFLIIRIIFINCIKRKNKNYESICILFDKLNMYCITISSINTWWK